ncbi:hypothetical protein ACLOJK_021308 [Asimina triloba]
MPPSIGLHLNRIGNSIAANCGLNVQLTRKDYLSLPGEKSPSASIRHLSEDSMGQLAPVNSFGNSLEKSTAKSESFLAYSVRINIEVDQDESQPSMTANSSNISQTAKKINSWNNPLHLNLTDQHELLHESKRTASREVYALDEFKQTSPRKKRQEDSNWTTAASARHKRGCNCKKSMCLKKLVLDALMVADVKGVKMSLERKKNLNLTDQRELLHESKRTASREVYALDEFKQTIFATRQQIESRTPLAFAPKIVRCVADLLQSSRCSKVGLGLVLQEDSNWTTAASARHKRGCSSSVLSVCLLVLDALMVADVKGVKMSLERKKPILCSYCDCFAAGVYCVDSCSCQECLNKIDYEDTVFATRQQIESRNPLAFAPKIVRRVADSLQSSREDSNWTTAASARHKRGCNCKKSMCLKKYCECYQAGVGCSDGCRCEGCKNVFGKKEGSGEALEVENRQVVDRGLMDSFSDGKIVMPETQARTGSYPRFSILPEDIQHHYPIPIGNSNSDEMFLKEIKENAAVIPYYPELHYFEPETTNMFSPKLKGFSDMYSFITSDQHPQSMSGVSNSSSGRYPLKEINENAAVIPYPSKASQATMCHPSVLPSASYFHWPSSTFYPNPHSLGHKLVPDPCFDGTLSNILEGEYPHKLKDMHSSRMPENATSADEKATDLFHYFFSQDRILSTFQHPAGGHPTSLPHPDSSFLSQGNSNSGEMFLKEIKENAAVIPYYPELHYFEPETTNMFSPKLKGFSDMYSFITSDQHPQSMSGVSTSSSGRYPLKEVNENAAVIPYPSKASQATMCHPSVLPSASYFHWPSSTFYTNPHSLGHKLVPDPCFDGTLSNILEDEYPHKLKDMHSSRMPENATSADETHGSPPTNCLEDLSRSVPLPGSRSSGKPIPKSLSFPPQTHKIPEGSEKISEASKMR